MASQKITLYHYTSSDGAEAIERSKMIKSSQGGRHARFGDGVYFTDMSPQDFTMTEVSTNNYRYPNAKKKLEYCIIVTMPKNKVSVCNAEKRRVFLHEGNVSLENKMYTYEIEKCKFKESQSNTTINAPKFYVQESAAATSILAGRRCCAEVGAAAMSNVTSDIDITASSYDLHVWLSSL